MLYKKSNLDLILQNSLTFLDLEHHFSSSRTLPVLAKSLNLKSGVPSLEKMPESNTTGYPAYTLCNFHPISHLSIISAPENTGLLPTNTPVSVSIRFILPALFNILRPRQNGCHFADGIFKCILFTEKIWILIIFSQKFLPICFQICFLHWKCLNFDWNVIYICSWESNWQEVSIGSRSDLAPNRQQAISWTDHDPFKPHICVTSFYTFLRI